MTVGRWVKRKKKRENYITPVIFSLKICLGLSTFNIATCKILSPYVSLQDAPCLCDCLCWGHWTQRGAEPPAHVLSATPCFLGSKSMTLHISEMFLLFQNFPRASRDALQFYIMCLHFIKFLL